MPLKSLQAYRDVRESLLQGYRDAGKIPANGTSRDVQAYLRRTLDGLYKDLADNDEIYKNMSAAKIKKHYQVANKKDYWLARGKTAGDVRSERALESADCMKFLTKTEIEILSFHTGNGYQHNLSVLVNPKKKPYPPGQSDRARELIAAQKVIQETLNARLERPAVQLYRSLGTYNSRFTGEDLADWLQSGKGIGKKMGLELTSSFSQNEQASLDIFMPPDGGIMFRVVTSKGIPVTSVSRHPEEMESIIVGGAVYRPVRAEMVIGKYIMDYLQVDLELLDSGETPDVRFSC